MSITGGGIVARRYRVVRAIGKGTVGDVFEVFDTDTERHCALTLLASALRSDPRVPQELLQHALRAECIEHTSVAKTLDSGLCDLRGAYVVRELCPGKTLEQLQRVIQLPSDLACTVGIQMLSAIAAGREHGLSHHGLSPSNVIAHLGSDDPVTIKVTDFGLACAPLSRGAPADWHTSTLRYAAPEVICGDTDNERSDLYSVGAILYELLSAKRFLGDTSGDDLRRRILSGDRAPLTQLNPGLPEPLIRVVNNALQLHPGARMGTAQEFARQLTPFLPTRRRSVASWVPVSLDPVLHMSAQLFGLEEDANPSLRLRRAPRPHHDSACPTELLREPVFPKSPKAPTLEALRAAVFGKPAD